MSKAVVVAVPDERSQLQVVNDTIALRMGQRAEHEQEVVRQTELERLAVENAVANPGLNPENNQPYFRGRPAYAAREAKRAAARNIEDLNIELAALGRRKELLTADESAERLKEAIEYVTPLHSEMAAAVTEAGELVAQIVRGPWEKWRAALTELVTVTNRGEGIAGEATAAVPTATQQWAQAVSSSFGQGVPSNVGWLIELVLVAAFDREGATSGGYTNPVLRELVPDLRYGGKLFAPVGKMTAFNRGAPFGQFMDSALRQSLEPHTAQPPERNAADLARAAEIEAERVRILNIQFERAGGAKSMVPAGFDDMRPTVTLDPGTQNRDDDTMIASSHHSGYGDPDGDGLTEAEKRELALLQAKDGDH